MSRAAPLPAVPLPAAPLAAGAAPDAAPDAAPAFASVVVVGLGYVGLPTAALLAGCGLRVLGVDASPEVVETVARGEVHLVEPGLAPAVAAAVAAGRLAAAPAPAAADAFLIAVPTPLRAGQGGDLAPDPAPDLAPDPAPDLSHVRAAAGAIAPVLKRGDLVVLESTSPIGTTARLAGWLADLRPDLAFPAAAGVSADGPVAAPADAPVDVHVAYCPERVLPGAALRELVENDRLIGGLTPACAARAAALYARAVTGACLLTDAATAEAAKLAENAFRDVNIAFANELSALCTRLGIDAGAAIALANRHPRVAILEPGPGVGGHCIAVDPWFLASAGSPEARADARLIRAARAVNDARPAWVLERVEAAAARLAAGTAQGGKRRREDLVLACWGLAYKPDTDDLRASPALAVAEALAARSALLVVEPHLAALPPGLAAERAGGGVRLVAPDAALAGADLHVGLVGHAAFRPHFATPPRGRLLDFCGGFGGRP